MRADWWDYIADDPADNQPRVQKKPPPPKTVGCVACRNLVAGEVGLTMHMRDKHKLLNPPGEIVRGETGNARAVPAMTGTLPVAGTPTPSTRHR